MELTTGRFRDALDCLSRISLLGPGVSAVLEPTLGEQAWKAVLGPERSWVHRTLEGVKDEDVLRKLLLRLLEASPSPPAYGHIRHGPLEHGKDVVVLLEEHDRLVLRMYQVKCGDVTTPVWRESRAELEEMFDAEVPDFQLRGEMAEREGILVCNGHANPYTESPMKGWFEKQLRDHGRKYQFMHLDDLVRWIDSQRLYSDFRAACADLGISTSPETGASTRPRTRRMKKQGTGRKSKGEAKRRGGRG
jgi:hypothetical protein